LTAAGTARIDPHNIQEGFPREAMHVAPLTVSCHQFRKIPLYAANGPRLRLRYLNCLFIDARMNRFLPQVLLFVVDVLLT
jgi:hypothetical protein